MVGGEEGCVSVRVPFSVFQSFSGETALTCRYINACVGRNDPDISNLYLVQLRAIALCRGHSTLQSLFPLPSLSCTHIRKPIAQK